VKAIGKVKADDISLELQSEFYEKGRCPLETQPQDSVVLRFSNAI